MVEALSKMPPHKITIETIYAMLQTMYIIVCNFVGLL